MDSRNQTIFIYLSISSPNVEKYDIVCTYKRENHRIAKEKKIYITKDKSSEILQNTKDKIHELNTPDK